MSLEVETRNGWGVEVPKLRRVSDRNLKREIELLYMGDSVV